MHESFTPPADVAEALERLETEVLSQPLSRTPWVDDVCRHTLSGGKRVRPLLLLLSGAAVGADRRQCLQLAGTVEVIHNATLLHDDVIDDAQMRRNRPSVNRLWSKQHGILAGDMLYARAFALIADLEAAPVRRLLAETACALAEAEFLQLRQKSLPELHIDEEMYFRILSGKTASLFRFCALAPALVAAVAPELQQRMATFGEQFGLAFQLTDDALDCGGSLEQTGKTPGTDLREGNLTLPLARALQQTDAAGRSSIEAALRSDNPSDEMVAQALQAVRATDAIEHSLDRCRNFVQRAVDALPADEDNPYLQALKQLTGRLLERTA